MQATWQLRPEQARHLPPFQLQPLLFHSSCLCPCQEQLAIMLLSQDSTSRAHAKQQSLALQLQLRVNALINEVPTPRPRWPDLREDTAQKLPPKSPHHFSLTAQESSQRSWVRDNRQLNCASGQTSFQSSGEDRAGPMKGHYILCAFVQEVIVHNHA